MRQQKSPAEVVQDDGGHPGSSPHLEDLDKKAQYLCAAKEEKLPSSSRWLLSHHPAETITLCFRWGLWHPQAVR